MCVILLQIHEKLMFYFCELYHEIIKQEIFLKSNETQQGLGSQNGHQAIYIIPSTYTGEIFGLLTCTINPKIIFKLNSISYSN